MKKAHYLLLLTIVFGQLTACQPVTPEPPVDPTDTTVVVVNEDTFPADSRYRDVALVGAITKAQPMTGLVLWPDQARRRHATYGSSIALEYSYCQPCKVVVGKDNGAIVYDWTWLEDVLDDIASRNHQAVLRFYYAYPGSRDVDGQRGTTAVPQYIKDMEGYEETYSANPGGDGPTYYPDWRSAELQWFTKQLYTDFAVRYGSDPRIAFLEVGFGHWAEYHIYGTQLRLGVNFPSHDYQRSLLTHLSEVMPIPWLISIDAADDTYTPIANDPALMALQFGLFDDSFMHREHELTSSDGYNERCWNTLSPRWQTGVCGGEISYYTSADQRNFLNPQGMYGTTWEEAAAKYHITFMLANDAPSGSYGTAARFLEASLASGYRFVITACQTSGDSTRLIIRNKGIAPIYRPAYVRLGDYTDATNLQMLQPGEALRLVLPGDASRQALTIHSEHILPTQQIQWAVKDSIE